ncbi:HAD family hydrolase [Nonomuraea sp. KC401]|uniref:HAD family hydrolase n=1 Tax=unclassified Nonomuraea TaxID=2593643 RepID=UPI0010FEA5CA|nr:MULTISPECIES: HAD family hydrolase [unclassified Nonomuraea]NBE93220.1 HAD-IA family hydrolase [Nonomuraea sp. K271]TLF58285.1 HAD family hydrolase [Nonomuraea sp. KC401]
MSHLTVFDLDGTLVDTPRAIVETFTGAFGALGVAAPGPAVIRATIGLPLERAFGDLLAAAPDGELVAQGIRHYQHLFKEIILPRAGELVFPGVAEGLDMLRARGGTLAVATSKFHASADALLRAAGLRDRFALVVGADQVSRPKPDPESGLLVLRTLGVHARHAVMVGDTAHDVHMANAAGMRSIAVTYGVHGADELALAGPTWIAGTFAEVVALLSAEPAHGAEPHDPAVRPEAGEPAR